MTTETKSLQEWLGEIPDPRLDRGKEHLLTDILMLTICAVICGANEWVEVEAYGKAKREFLSTLLELPNGIPSHDTLGRVFSLLDADVLRTCFLGWVHGVAQVTEGEVIAIDGKTLRGSGKGKKEFVHMVSAWATENHLSLGQRKVDNKSNEITAIPKLLEVLHLKGCIVTIDAIGCQKDIAEQIIDQEADYVLALKDNQASLREGVEFLFRDSEDRASAYFRSLDKDHGRVEKRECWVLDDIDALERLTGKEAWKGLQTVVKLKSTRTTSSGNSVDERYYLSSLPKDAELLLQTIRSHWGIENSLHWVLDVAFREDESRLRTGYSAENFALIRHIAINLLKQDTTKKIGVKAKRLTAGWDNSYLLKLLGG